MTERHDGKQLESLVAFVEEQLLPPGFEVRSNELVFNDEGVQIAEFDIEIRGKVGSTTIAWLIECRDRPGHGPAPGSWIEQLVGRRTRFAFNKVTAVSTTGFTTGAKEFAQQQGIELREVRSLDPSEFSDWLHITAIRQVKRVSDLKHADIILDGTQDAALLQAAAEAIRTAKGDDAILVSSVDHAKATVSQAFLTAVQSIPDAFESVSPVNPKNLQICAKYKDDSHFSIETPLGLARVHHIVFVGQLRIEESEIPVVKTVEYRHVETGERISQLVAFSPHSVLGMDFSFELHRMAESGETHVALRRLPDEKTSSS